MDTTSQASGGTESDRIEYLARNGVSKVALSGMKNGK